MQEAAELLLRILFLEELLESVEESKRISTHGHVSHRPTAGTKLRTIAHTNKALRNIDKWRDVKKTAHTTAFRQYDALKNVLSQKLMNLVNRFRTGAISEKVLRSGAHAAFQEAYELAYRAGLKASGITSLDRRKSALGNPSMDHYDAAWLRTALAQERSFWNSFCDELVSGEIDEPHKRFTPAERVAMYVQTLDHVRDVARVVGHPKHTLIYWQLNPAEHCAVCIYLQKISPFTRETLPGVPRDGHTCLGLSNCKCSLRMVTTDDVASWERVKQSKRLPEIQREINRLKKVRPSVTLGGRQRVVRRRG